MVLERGETVNQDEIAPTVFVQVSYHPFFFFTDAGTLWDHAKHGINQASSWYWYL